MLTLSRRGPLDRHRHHRRNHSPAVARGATLVESGRVSLVTARDAIAAGSLPVATSTDGKVHVQSGSTWAAQIVRTDGADGRGLLMPGNSTNYLQGPAHTMPTGDVQFDLDFVAPAVTAGVLQRIVGQDASGQRSWQWLITTGGNLQLVLSANGSAVGLPVYSAVGVVVAGKRYRIRAIYRASTGNVEWTDLDGVIGAETDAAIGITGNLWQSTAAPRIGQVPLDPATPARGIVRRVAVGPVGGPATLDFDPTSVQAAPGATSITDAAGLGQWTIVAAHADSNDATLVDPAGIPFLSFPPGNDGNNAVVGPILGLSGDIKVRARFRTPVLNTAQVVASAFHDANPLRSWLMLVDSLGRLQWAVDSDGTGTAYRINTTISTALTANTWYVGEATRNATTGAWTITATPDSGTVLSASGTGTSGAMHPAAKEVQVGRRSSSAQPFLGDIAWAEVYDGLAATVPVWAYSAADHPEDGSTSYVDPVSGETNTLAYSGTLPMMPVKRPMWLLHGPNSGGRILSIANAFTPKPGTNIPFSLLWRGTMWNTSTWAPMFDSRSATSSVGGWLVGFYNAEDNFTSYLFGTTAGVASGGVNTRVAAVRRRLMTAAMHVSSTQHWNTVNGAKSPVVTRQGEVANNAIDTFISKAAQSTSFYAQSVECLAVAYEALTDADLADLDAYIQARQAGLVI